MKEYIFPSVDELKEQYGDADDEIEDNDWLFGAPASRTRPAAKSASTDLPVHAPASQGKERLPGQVAVQVVQQLPASVRGVAPGSPKALGSQKPAGTVAWAGPVKRPLSTSIQKGATGSLGQQSGMSSHSGERPKRKPTMMLVPKTYDPTTSRCRTPFADQMAASFPMPKRQKPSTSDPGCPETSLPAAHAAPSGGTARAPLLEPPFSAPSRTPGSAPSLLPELAPASGAQLPASGGMPSRGGLSAGDASGGGAGTTSGGPPARANSSPSARSSQLPLDLSECAASEGPPGGPSGEQFPTPGPQQTVVTRAQSAFEDSVPAAPDGVPSIPPESAGRGQAANQGQQGRGRGRGGSGRAPQGRGQSRFGPANVTGLGLEGGGAEPRLENADATAAGTGAAAAAVNGLGRRAERRRGLQPGGRGPDGAGPGRGPVKRGPEESQSGGGAGPEPKKQKTEGKKQKRGERRGKEANALRALANGKGSSGAGEPQMVEVGLAAELKEWEKGQRKVRGKAAAGGREDEKDFQRGRRSAYALDAAAPKKAPCMFYLQGRCKLGADCPYPHEGEPERRPICRFHRMANCVNGDACRFSHDLSGEPCKHMVLTGACPYGAKCGYSHEELAPEAAAELREKYAAENARRAQLGLTTVFGTAPAATAAPVPGMLALPAPGGAPKGPCYPGVNAPPPGGAWNPSAPPAWTPPAAPGESLPASGPLPWGAWNPSPPPPSEGSVPMSVSAASPGGWYTAAPPGGYNSAAPLGVYFSPTSGSWAPFGAAEAGGKAGPSGDAFGLGHAVGIEREGVVPGGLGMGAGREETWGQQNSAALAVFDQGDVGGYDGGEGIGGGDEVEVLAAGCEDGNEENDAWERERQAEDARKAENALLREKLEKIRAPSLAAKPTPVSAALSPGDFLKQLLARK